jgi:hypothetical protein
LLVGFIGLPYHENACGSGISCNGSDCCFVVSATLAGVLVSDSMSSLAAGISVSCPKCCVVFVV